MAEGLERGEDPLNLLRKGECVIEGGTREPSFFLVASQQRRFVVMATTRRYFFRHLRLVPFGEGTMRRTGRD